MDHIQANIHKSKEAFSKNKAYSFVIGMSEKYSVKINGYFIFAV